MFIGELAKRSGLSRDTIRYYEKLELLVVEHRHADNDYKIYGNDSLNRLQQIQRLKDVGFTLREIRQLLVQDEFKHQCTDLPKLLANKLATIDKQIAMLDRFKTSLLGVKSLCNGDCEAYKGLPMCFAALKSAAPPTPTSTSARCC